MSAPIKSRINAFLRDEGSFVLAAFLGALAATGALWLSSFPFAGDSLQPIDVFFEAMYFCAALVSLLLVRRTGQRLLETGWMVFTFGLFLDLLDEFTIDPALLNVQVEGTITSCGLICVAAGAYVGAKRFRGELAERKEVERKLEESERQYRLISENVTDAVFIQDMQLNLVYVSPSVESLSGYSPEELYGMSMRDYMTPESWERARELFSFYASRASRGERVDVPLMEYEYVCKDGSTFWGELKVKFLFDDSGNPCMHQGVLRDITERKGIEQRLKRLSLEDSLTGLCNRACFEEEMQRLEERGRTPIGLIVCDLDGLKLVNDSLGHGTGDALLKQTAGILRQCFRQGDTIARIGGDEFAVLLPEGDAEAVNSACERIKAAFERYNAQSPRVPLSVSLGWAVCSGAADNLQDLFREADNNMYREKVLRSRSARSHMVQALLKTLEARDYLTEGHGERMQRLVLAMGTKLGLPEASINDLRLLAQFHDLGKIGIPDNILFKPGPLSGEEYRKMQEHCEIGYRIALSAPQLAPIADFILKHHEWWDGRGYPLGLQGEDIPLECRILSIVDAYDTITSARPYKEARAPEEAMRELKRCAGTQFDPELVAHFVELMRGLEEERTDIPDSEKG